MGQRTNVGHVITDSVHIGDTEFVIGQSEHDPARFVTWACDRGDYYYWGHYLTSREDAERDLIKRASERIRYLNSIRGKNNLKRKRSVSDKWKQK